jgi:hypothetical protein
VYNGFNHPLSESFFLVFDLFWGGGLTEDALARTSVPEQVNPRCASFGWFIPRKVALARAKAPITIHGKHTGPQVQ